MAAGVLATGLSGCLKTTSPQSSTTPVAYISIMHLAPLAPSTDVYFNDVNVLNQSLPPLNYFNSYGSISPGTFDVKFKAAGTDSLMASLPSAQYDSLNFYTLILYNDAQDSTRAARVHDDFSSLTSSSFLYRFFNMSPDAPAVDCYLDSTRIASSRQTADNIASSYYDEFQSYTPGTYALTVKAAGTDSVLATLYGNTFIAGNAYTIFLRGLSNGTGTQALKVDVLRAAN